MRHKLIEGHLDALRPQGHERTLSREQPARPQAVGFWCDPARARMRARFGEGDAYVAFLREYHETEARSGKPFFPDPDIILEILGPKRPEEPVARYLESGLTFREYFGYASCRCCALDGPDMGSRDITDGTWVWPEGLAHYVRVHDVPLPEEFLQTLARNSYAVPRLSPFDLDALSSLTVDYAFWQQWSSRVYRRRDGEQARPNEEV